MTKMNSDFWDKAHQIRETLARQFLDHPEVSLIDIGRDLGREGQGKKQRIVVRVHLKRQLTREALGLPTEIDGIPVELVVADYRLE
jgi:hypothetical protein